MKLAEKVCLPCHGNIPPLKSSEMQPLLAELTNWELIDDKRLTKSYVFRNFAQAMDLAKKVADLAEEQQHHPDLLVKWGELRIDVWTHSIDGLTESDFILAAKIDSLAGG